MIIISTYDGFALVFPGGAPELRKVAAALEGLAEHAEKQSEPSEPRVYMLGRQHVALESVKAAAEAGVAFAKLRQAHDHRDQS